MHSDGREQGAKVSKNNERQAYPALNQGKQLLDLLLSLLQLRFKVCDSFLKVCHVGCRWSGVYNTVQRALASASALKAFEGESSSHQSNSSRDTQLLHAKFEEFYDVISSGQYQGQKFQDEGLCSFNAFTNVFARCNRFVTATTVCESVSAQV